MSPIKSNVQLHQCPKKYRIRRGKKSSSKKAEKMLLYLDKIQSKTVASLEEKRGEWYSHESVYVTSLTCGLS